MDIGTLGSVQDKEEEGTWIEVRNEAGEKEWYKTADGQEKAVRIRVAGTYSKRFKRVSEAQRDRLLKKRRMQLNVDQLDDNTRAQVAACTLEWEGFFSGTTPYECTQVNAEALYKQAPWIQEQVEEAMQDHAGFFKTSSKA